MLSFEIIYTKIVSRPLLWITALENIIYDKILINRLYLRLPPPGVGVEMLKYATKGI